MSFVQVQVEEHEALPDGCSKRWRALDAGRPLSRVRYESEDGVTDTWTVTAVSSDRTRTPATGYAVEDSSAGTSTLVVGGDHGLRLLGETTGTTIAEPTSSSSRRPSSSRSALVSS